MEKKPISGRPVSRVAKTTAKRRPAATAKSKKVSAATKSNSPKHLYSSLAYRRKMKKEERERKRAEDLATLPKHPVARFFAHLHPKRVLKYWFSKRGVFMVLKIIGVMFLLGALGIGGLFLYFKKDLAAIRPEELANRVANTVNVYLDRNGEILWEDKGDGDYRLVVDGDQISTYMRQATVAAEDRRFYEHIGVDFMGLMRAFWSTVSGQQVQGGSTLTQQLIKQVYFSDEAANRDMSGIPRKIKETILAIEVENMYSKEEIITLYLNESPYGGRRNGVESGAQTYFGKSSKDLNIAESALLAAIPNNPAIFNPYNTGDLNLNGVLDSEELLGRQRYTIEIMVELGYITREEADVAKEIDILNTILPETSQYKDIKAPHFVLEVKKQLEEKYGVRTMRAGGFTITTTLDYRAQLLAEEAVRSGEKVMKATKLPVNNLAMSSVDVETGQVIAMVGSVDWNRPGYGQTNAATQLLEPGSTIKPLLDYAPLFVQREGQNFGPGSVLYDENIDKLYCGGSTGSCQLRNYTGRFYGNVTIRQSLANSLNIPAVKALAINGIEQSTDTVRRMGNLSYCTEDPYAGLSQAIGTGCRIRQVEHTNAFATIARGGTYKPLAYVLEVKNSDGDTIDRWEDTPGERVVDEQVAYMIADIMADANARKLVFGTATLGFKIPNVVTGTKTGTTNGAKGNTTKDNWTASYSPVIATTAWAGRHDGAAWYNSGNTENIPRTVIQEYMDKVHNKIYIPEGKYSKNQSFARPAGIKEMTIGGKKDIWPSWFTTKNTGTEKTTLIFDKISKRLATDCTPAAYRVEIEVSKTIDPISKRETWYVPSPYDRTQEDNVHQCGLDLPDVTSASASWNEATSTLTVNFSYSAGDYGGATYEIIADGTSLRVSSTGNSASFVLDSKPKTVIVKVKDSVGHVDEATASGL